LFEGGKVICNKCAQSSNRSKCEFCSIEHRTNGEGFPICKPILDLLTEEPLAVDSHHSAKTLKQNLKLIQNQLNDLKFDLNNSTALLQQHFASLRNDVQLCTENLIKNININCNSLLSRIDETEQHYLELLKSKKTHFSDTFTKDIEEIAVFHSKWNEYLDSTTVDNNLIIQGNSSANFIRKILEKKRCQLNNFIFDDKIIRFKKNNSKLSENIIGMFKVKKIASLSLDELNWGTVLFEKNC
jgi:hypothetical protein